MIKKPIRGLYNNRDSRDMRFIHLIIIYQSEQLYKRMFIRFTRPGRNLWDISLNGTVGTYDSSYPLYKSPSTIPSFSTIPESDIIKKKYLLIRL